MANKYIVHGAQFAGVYSIGTVFSFFIMPYNVKGIVAYDRTPDDNVKLSLLFHSREAAAKFRREQATFCRMTCIEGPLEEVLQDNLGDTSPVRRID